jgi:CheY-like chemotaxis protein/HPt (histidine-containing phosphotransfer) domain-containing protein
VPQSILEAACGDVNDQKQMTGLIILLAEDSPVSMVLAKMLAEKLLPSATIHEAVNGEQAVEKAIATRPDIILMDVQMGKTDGLQATKAIREKITDKEIPIIAVTGGYEETDREMCLEAGMNDFISKPIGEDTLRGILKKWIGDKDSFQSYEHINMDVLHASGGNDEEFERELMELAIRSIEDSITKFKQQAIDRDLGGIRANGHKLKGTASAVGLFAMSKLAEKMDKMEEIKEQLITELRSSLEGELLLVRRIGKQLK